MKNIVVFTYFIFYAFVGDAGVYYNYDFFSIDGVKMYKE